jgi:Leucine-rich repeat (LRR) protein
MPSVTVFNPQNIKNLEITTITPTPAIGAGGVLNLTNFPNLAQVKATGINLSSVINIKDCPKLTSLSINNNNMSGPVPDLNLLTGMRQLTAHGNRFSYIPQTNFSSNTNLQNYLIYNCTGLTGFLPSSITGLVSCQQFSVNNCKLSGTLYAPNSINLSIFNSYTNSFTGAFPDLSFVTGKITVGANNNNFTTFNGGFPNNFYTTGSVFNLSVNKFTSTAIANILQAAVNAGNYYCTLSINGNARATGTQNTENIATLSGRGWTVNFS